MEPASVFKKNLKNKMSKVTKAVKKFEIWSAVQICIGIGLFLLSQYLIIRLGNKTLFSWWANNHGDLYNNLFNLTGYCASRQSTIWYYICYYTGNLFNTLTKTQILFLNAVPLKNILAPDSTGVNQGFVLPRHLCNSIKFESGENPLVDSWLVARDKTYPGISFDNAAVYNWDPKYIQSYIIPLEPPSTLPKIPPLVLNKPYGVYPALDDIQGWICKFIEWGVPFFMTNSTSGETYTLPYSDENTYPITYRTWFGLDASGKKDPNWAHTDNFLAWYGIPWDSDLIVGFINQKWYTHGNQVSTQGLKSLLAPSYGAAGGWVGFVQAIGASNVSMEDMLSVVFSSVSQPVNAAEADRDSNCNGAGWAGAMAGGIASGAGIFMAGHSLMSASAGEAATMSGNPWLSLFTIVLSLGATAGSVYSAQSNCNVNTI